MSSNNDAGGSQHDGAGDEQNYDRLEAAIETAQDRIDEAAQSLPEFAADLEDIDERFEDLRNDADRAQEADDPDELGDAPAQVDYSQQVIQNLEEHVHDDGGDLAAGETAIEVVEEYLEEFDIGRTTWFAQVDGIPTTFSQQVVNADQLEQVGDLEGDTSQYVLHSLRTPQDDVSEAEATFTEDKDQVDLDEYTFFKTEKSAGGVV